MGVLNATPDSFSDGFSTTTAAIEHGLRMMAEGADIIDVGGESTRPGASGVTATVEQARVLPVIEALVAQGAIVSVDTMRATTALAAIQRGANLVNDVSGGLMDTRMAAVIAEHPGVGFVVSHWRGPAGGADTHTDPVAEVGDELAARVQSLIEAGVARSQLIVDPGLGFAKSAETNWRLLAGIEQLHQRLGLPLLIGASRKRFLGAVVGDAAVVVSEANTTSDSAVVVENPRPRTVAEQRRYATVAVTALAAASGAWAVRVHDVAANRDAIAVAAAWVAHKSPATK